MKQVLLTCEKSQDHIYRLVERLVDFVETVVEIY